MRVNMGREGRTSSSLSANGGSMLGALILANGPSQPLEAATKYYVDSTFANLNANNVLDGILPISSLPGFTGDATSVQGSNVITLANLGVTPGSYAKVIVDVKGRVTGNDILAESDIPNVGWDKVQNKPNTFEGYGITDGLSITGGVFSGQMSVITPTNSMSSVSKQYVDAALSGNSAVVGDIIRKPYASTPTGFLRCNGGVVDKTMYADLYAVIGDNFGVNTVPGSGRPWEQQYDINTLQTGNISNWTAYGSLPYGVLYHKCVITKHRVYVIGGGNSGSRFSSVYTAPIQSDGAIGVWVAAGSLPGEFAYFNTFVTKNYLYLIGGGTNAIGILNTVYMAPINADGTLGTWTTSGNFPVAHNSSQIAVLKNRVYVFGGGVNSAALDTIYMAAINSDGTLGTWSLYGNIPGAMSGHSIAVTKNRIYLLGGGNGTVGFTSNVYTTTINIDGTLGTWSVAQSLPIPITVGCIFVTKNCVYLLGGATALNTYSANTYRANINLDGTLSGWEYMGVMPYTLGYSTCVVVKNKIHVIGGYLNSGVSSTVMSATINSVIQDYSAYYEVNAATNYMMPGSGKPWQQQYQINTTQTGDIVGWTSNPDFPVTLSSAQVIVTKNYVYVIGNANPVTGNKVYKTSINTDGSLGVWSLDTNSLPITLSGSQLIMTKNRVYLLSGYNDFNNSYISTVYTTSINTDGTLGAWTTSGTNLPDSLAYSSAVITKNRVYLLGGLNSLGQRVSTVYTAPINTDGTLGSWATGTNLPTELQSSQCFITKNRVYLCGGSNNTGRINTIYSAIINENGIIGSWNNVGTLPDSIINSSVFITKNKVYLLGGQAASALSTVYTATINSDGTIGTWSTGTNLPETIFSSSVFVTKNKVYLLGGYNPSNSGFLRTVYSASILEGLNDYSSYYDGSIIPLEPIDPSTLFALPDFSSKEKNGVNLYIKY